MDSIGEQFIDRTKHNKLGPSDQALGKPNPPIQLEFNETQPIIKLPKPSEIVTEPVELRRVIEQRKSIRNYSTVALTIEQLSYLLWCTQGVKTVVQGISTLRNVPSAGARHAFETYLLINNVKGITPGLYRFLALEHSLISVSLDQYISDKVTKACFNQTFIKSSSVTFIWTVIPYRMNWRYGERGYRYLYLDAGHVCQNLYLSAESINCGACAIAAYSDDELNQLLGLDGKEQFVIYLATVGMKR
ncbi:SagB/ThcOx family dehydrogenase [Desulfosporosinus sp. PR]|uniref:SagB/ThcOx family dehydrogenase n=1 Tax=Candidatus Desulfosporosinus nitrosoreducens TaxID=3401928 RepID=UPI0027EAAE63|nr:SagB/ThcOx family dehydrogenase [Desulfosporosinus sp. PR]MDQ7096618.1 SagB/ThcOx family dehydrogenase [Desulfosporosinus sp. PR]